MWIIFEHGCFNLNNSSGVTMRDSTITIHSVSGELFYVASSTDKAKLEQIYNVIISAIKNGAKVVDMKRHLPEVKTD